MSDGSGVRSFLPCDAALTEVGLRHSCGHRSRAGFLNANQVMPVRIRLTVPNFRNPQLWTAGRQFAQLGLQNRADSGQHRDAVPLSDAGSPSGRRQRLHTPPFMGSNPIPATILGPLDYSGNQPVCIRQCGERSPGGPPIFRGGSSLKTRAGL